MRTLVHAALIAGMVGTPFAPLAAARLTPEEQLAQLTEGRVAGKPVDCINMNISSNDSRKIPGLAMAYRQGTTWYVNRFKGGCPALREDRRIVTRGAGGQLCENDPVRVTETTGHDFGFCTFDKFVPYKR